jgi:hypothetical protein
VAGGARGGGGLAEKIVLRGGGHGGSGSRNEKGGAYGSALWCCVLIRYFYCFKLDGVIWQVSAWRANESTERAKWAVSSKRLHDSPAGGRLMQTQQWGG